MSRLTGSSSGLLVGGCASTGNVPAVSAVGGAAASPQLPGRGVPPTPFRPRGTLHRTFLVRAFPWERRWLLLISSTACRCAGALSRRRRIRDSICSGFVQSVSRARSLDAARGRRSRGRKRHRYPLLAPVNSCSSRLSRRAHRTRNRDRWDQFVPRQRNGVVARLSTERPICRIVRGPAGELVTGDLEIGRPSPVSGVPFPLNAKVLSPPGKTSPMCGPMPSLSLHTTFTLRP